MRVFFVIASVLCLMPLSHAFAQSKPVTQHVPSAQKVGEGRLSVLLWDVYDATLYAPDKKYTPNKPFALQLSYLLELEGADIAKRSVEEMRKQGFADEAKLDAWLKSMRDIFPDIKEGNVLTGIRNSAGHALFYLDDTFVGSVKDETFTDHFFAIWLKENTSEPTLRKALLGIGA
jgi:hypothetical protein